MTARLCIISTASHVKRRQHALNASSKSALRRFAVAVTARRIELDISRSDLAKQTGISYGQMAHIENGDNWPTLPVFRRLCRVLRCGRVPLL